MFQIRQLSEAVGWLCVGGASKERRNIRGSRDGKVILGFVGWRNGIIIILVGDMEDYCHLALIFGEF